MGDVTPIRDPNTAEFNYCSYYEIEGDLGVSLSTKALAIVRLNADEFELLFDLPPGAESMLFKREELAEFLKLAGIYIDPGDKWMPRGEIVCSDY